MMFCHKCGIKVAVGAGFCQKCGAKVTSVDIIQESENHKMATSVTEVELQPDTDNKTDKSARAGWLTTLSASIVGSFALLAISAYLAGVDTSIVKGLVSVSVICLVLGILSDIISKIRKSLK